MSLPYAFSQSGILVGFIFLAGVALLTFWTMSLIISAVHMTRARLRRRKMIQTRHAQVLAGTDFEQQSASAVTNNNASYGSVNGTATIDNLDPDFLQRLQSSPRPIDSIDSSVIEADPDLDIIGYQQVAYVAFGERSVESAKDS